MEYQRRATSLVVLTLLQLCRAEIKDTQQHWYSANIINDRFQPKPIAELFSTEQPFSTASPIVVSSDFSNSYSGDDGYISSTQAPSTKLFSIPSTSFTRQTTFATSPPTASPMTPQQQQYMPHMTTLTQQTFPQMDLTSVEIPQKTTPPDFEKTRSLLVSELPTQPQRNVQVQQSTPTTWMFHPSTVTETPTIFQSPVTETTLSGEILRYELPKTPQQSTTRPPTPVPQQPIPPDYFLIYQQAPQSHRGIFTPEEFLSTPQTTAQETFTTTSPVSSTFPSTQSSTFSTFSSTVPSTISSTPSTFPSSPLTIRTSPVVSTSAPTTQQFFSSTTPSTPKATVISTSTLGSSARTSRTTFISDCRHSTTPMPHGVMYPLKIRVLSPKGSITNVNINPVQKVHVTTRKPTTTKRPTTRRTPKPKKNTYERCLHGCRKHGQTLCAAPVGMDPIHPDELRGFSSVCHMACHNSFKKIPYEKIIDGSCGRLRTRIRPIDSNSKLKKDELHKVQYILDNSGQKAIVEFTGLYT